MEIKDILNLAKASHSGKEFRDGIVKSFTFEDYRTAIDADYEGSPFIKAMTYAGVRPVVVPAVGDVATEFKSSAPHTPGEEKEEKQSKVGAIAPLKYYYKRLTIDRLDLVNMGDELFASLVKAMRQSVEYAFLNANFATAAPIWSDSALATSALDGTQTPDEKTWLISYPAQLLALTNSVQTDVTTFKETLGFERLYPILNGWQNDKAIIANPAAFYLCGEREPSLFVDEDRWRMYNKVELVMEQAVGFAYDPSRVKVYTW